MIGTVQDRRLEPSHTDRPFWLSIYDPEPKKPVRQKLEDAIARYVKKFGERPTFCLTSALDAAELAVPTKAHPGELPVQVQARGYVSRFVYYVGTGSL